MKINKIFIFVFLVSLILAGIAAAFAPDTDRYVSGWVLVQAGQIHNFEHNLGTRPLEVSAWAALHVNRSDYDAIPLYQTDVEIQGISPYVISVHNLGDTDWLIQVVASR